MTHTLALYCIYSGTCQIRHTKVTGKCVGLYRMSQYSGFILVNRKLLLLTCTIESSLVIKTCLSLITDTCQSLNITIHILSRGLVFHSRTLYSTLSSNNLITSVRVSFEYIVLTLACQQQAQHLDQIILQRHHQGLMVKEVQHLVRHQCLANNQRQVQQLLHLRQMFALRGGIYSFVALLGSHVTAFNLGRLCTECIM
jgi:hypothetical protein